MNRRRSDSPRSSANAKRRSPPRRTASRRTASRSTVRRPQRAPFQSRMTRPPTSDLTIGAIAARQRWDLVEPLLTGTPAAANPSEALSALRRFVTSLVAWNSNVSNLISKNDVARIVDRHLAESLESAGVFANLGRERWLDFGSGAGFPAIPLALVGVGVSWQLVESRRPKTLFLRKVLQELPLKHMAVVHDRLENLPPGEPFDAFTARATEAIGPTLRAAAPHIRPGGTACLWKGSSWQAELEPRSAWAAEWEIGPSITLIGRPSVIVLFNKK